MDTNRPEETPDNDMEIEAVPVSSFDGINMSNKREEGELFCDYRCRQWWVKRLIKFYLKGKPVWHGHMGTRVGSL